MALGPVPCPRCGADLCDPPDQLETVLCASCGYKMAVERHVSSDSWFFPGAEGNEDDEDEDDE